MKPKKLSIIIPCFNSDELLYEAAYSAIESFQGVLEGEIIIVDDGSTSSLTMKILRKLEKNEHIRVHRNMENSGVAYSRNIGVEVSEGEWISFLDADDILDVDSVRIRWEVAQSLPLSGWLATDYSLIDYDGKVVSENYFRCQAKQHQAFRLVEIAYNTAAPIVFNSAFLDGWVSSVPAFTGTVMMRRTTFFAVGGFDTTLTIGEDTHLWTRLSFPDRPFIFIPKVTAFYRQGTGGLTSGKKNGYYQAPYLESLIASPDFKIHRAELRSKLYSHWLIGAYEARCARKWWTALVSVINTIRWDCLRIEAWRCLIAIVFLRK